MSDIEIQKEARRLKERFADVPNREVFASEHGIKGKGAMIYQHINGLKPISLSAGIAYAKAFGCSLEDISPRLAKLVKPIAPENHKLKTDERTLSSDQVTILQGYDCAPELVQKMLLAHAKEMIRVHGKKKHRA